MTEATTRARGLYFEEYSVGQKIITQGRTVTEADIVNFCGFTGDFSQLHTNAEFAKTIPFKQRIAHGMLTMSMATGLAVMTGTLEETIVAFESIDSWQFKRPVFIGDTVHVELEVTNTEEKSESGDMVDQATNLLERNISLSLTTAEKEILEEIEGALERIGDKTYGICVDSGQVINKARLKAIPEASRTAEAQEKFTREQQKIRRRMASG